MGLYLGKDKISALRTIEKTMQSMKAYLEAGGKCSSSTATSFDGCWQASDWENVTDFYDMFSFCGKLTFVPPMDTGNATNMKEMFYYCSNLVSAPAMDASNVTDMSFMFQNCQSITSIPQMNTGNVTNMRSMFYGCRNIRTIPTFDTSKVTDMISMFQNCQNITTIPMLDTSNVTNMNNIFDYCRNLESIHMRGMRVSFNISASTKFTREALVEILNNLATVTTSPTLTMGSTNLAKLTDADKAIATGKGWKLA